MWSGVSVEHMVLIYKLPYFRPQSLAIVAVRTLQTPPFQLKSISSTGCFLEGVFSDCKVERSYVVV